MIEAAVWGTTVLTAATAKLAETTESGSLVELTAAVERALLAELPEGLDRLLATLAQRAALDADVVHLMEALPALARAHRYGDVRGTDTSALATVAGHPGGADLCRTDPGGHRSGRRGRAGDAAADGSGPPRDRAAERRQRRPRPTEAVDVAEPTGARTGSPP